MHRDISDPLRRLAALVRAPLLGEMPPAFTPDRGLLDFALRRHRVGPQMHVARQRSGPKLDGDDAKLIALHFLSNARRFAATEFFLRELAAKFHAEKIPWLTFKGVTLARQLYPEPTWRHVNDVDLLVPPELFDDALRLLKRDGLTITHTQRDPERWLERSLARFAKDVMLRDARSGLNIELHRRLFFASAEEKKTPLLRDAFAARLGLTEVDAPSPGIGPALALYLLLHGANSRWFRLKWLADLLLLASRIDEASLQAIASAADILQASVSAKAGFQLLAWVFGNDTVGLVAPWLNEKSDRALVEARARTYLQALDRSDGGSPARKGSQIDSLAVYYSTMDNPSYRAHVLMRGAAWIALRTLNKYLP